MADIKIFVSNRTDKPSEQIKNSLFFPILCGATFQHKKSEIAGDDTGENISNKKILFRELTVQYWAWKNVEADYYGFCQYKRYFSFSNKLFPTEKNIKEKYIDTYAVEKYLIKEKNMSEEINKYDLLISKPIKLKRNYNVNTVLKYVQEKEKAYPVKNINIFMQVLLEKYPKYKSAMEIYLQKEEMIFYNIYIMKKEIFQEYSALLFDIMFDLEKRIDTSVYSYQEFKNIHLLSEVLFGIYITYLRENKNISIKELQLVEFSDPKPKQVLVPAYKENMVPIVLSSSDYYVPYLATMIRSIIDHLSENHNYDLVVLESAITDVNKAIITEMLRGIKNVSLRFYNVQRDMDGIQLNAGGHISVETFYRLLIPDIFRNYDKILYLDSDMTVHADVAQLFKTDVSDYLVAAAYDQCISAFYNGSDKTFMPYCKEVLKLEDPYSYFQAGVMVMNLKNFRETYTTQEILSFATSRQFTYVDQDILNSLCRGRVKHFDLSWNVFPEWGDYKKTYMAEFIFEEYEEARKNPKIMHYTGPIKPWGNPNADIAMSTVFWSVARRTPFYEIMLYRMSSEVSHYVAYHTKKASRTRARFKDFVHSITDKMFPKTTKRRFVIKRIYFTLRGWKVPNDV